MKQHNAATTTDGRNIWGSARERERTKARFNIRQRVNHSNSRSTAVVVAGPSPPASNAPPAGGAHAHAANTHTHTHTHTHRYYSDEVISGYLSYIRRGDRSKFSTTFLDRHFVVLSARHPIRRHVLDDPETRNDTIKSAAKAAAAAGHEHEHEHEHEHAPGTNTPRCCCSVDLLRRHMESVSTFTFMEYAVWLGKYSIVSGMLHGGVNPCVRGSSMIALPPFDSGAISSGDAEKHEQQQLVLLQRQQRQRQELEEIGSSVLKRFFDCFPLRLSTYIVKRVVEMRKTASASIENSRHETLEDHRRCDTEGAAPSKNDGNGKAEARTLHKDDPSPALTPTFRCPICCDRVSVEFQLRFGNNNNNNNNTSSSNANSCQHVFCEFCFWKDVLAHIGSPAKREAKDVVSCLVCGRTETSDTSNTNTNTNTHFLHQDTSHLSPTEKRELSLERLHRLPANQHELKRRSSKKKKVSEADHLAANWIDAVFPSLGSTQDVRRDKFALHTERNAVTYVRGCLLAGVDVDQVNQYGQSALYVAAWRGCIEIVKLLLEYGADPSLPANGGSTVRGLCSAIPRRNNRRVLELMDENQDRDQCNGSSSTATTTTTTSIKYDAGNDADSRLMQFCSRNNQMSPSIPNANGVVLQNDPRLLNTLIPASSDHPGAGSCFIDEAISSDAVNALLELFRSLPVDRDQKQKKNSAPCSDRSYYCDAEGSLRRYLGNVIVGAGVASAAASVESGTNGDGDGDDNGNDDMAVVGNNHPSSATVIADRSESSSSSSVVRVFPHMRFLNYSIPGAVLPPHIDLRHVNPFCRPSDMQNPKHKSTHTFILYLTDCHSGGETRLLQEVTPDGSSPSLATVSPRRGRLLIFPHPTPHEGMEVMDVPKILLRGELQISTNE